MQKTLNFQSKNRVVSTFILEIVNKQLKINLNLHLFGFINLGSTIIVFVLKVLEKI